jgi:hypothetical protein
MDVHSVPMTLVGVGRKKGSRMWVYVSSAHRAKGRMKPTTERTTAAERGIGSFGVM